MKRGEKMKLRKRCGGDCQSCRRGCTDREEPVMSPNRTPNGSEMEDIRGLGQYLSERYTAQSLIAEVRRVYDPNYLAFFGVHGAMESYLTHFRDSLGLKIDREDIRIMANAITDRGDFGGGL